MHILCLTSYQMSLLMNKSIPSFNWIEINTSSQLIWYSLFVTFQRLSSITVVLIRIMRAANNWTCMFNSLSQGKMILNGIQVAGTKMQFYQLFNKIYALFHNSHLHNAKLEPPYVSQHLWVHKLQIMLLSSNTPNKS